MIQDVCEGARKDKRTHAHALAQLNDTEHTVFYVQQIIGNIGYAREVLLVCVLVMSACKCHILIM